MPDEQLLISPCGRASIGSMPGEWPRQKKCCEAHFFRSNSSPVTGTGPSGRERHEVTNSSKTEFK